MLVNLNDVLADAQVHHYAVGLFNATDSDMLQAAISAAEEARSPIIIGTAEVLLPYGELSLIAPSMIKCAERASVPVVVHFDHGLTFERCIEALRLGFSSVMFDGSGKPYEENVRQTREITAVAHAFGATVEGEIGHVGEADAADNCNAELYTTPEEAAAYLEDTGVDALAVSVGTAHGKYIKTPQLDIKRLEAIRRFVKTPLVLHGGSGLSDEDFKSCIRAGVAKINIFTDICLAGEAAIRRAADSGLGYLEMRNLKTDAMKAEILKKMELFGSYSRV